MKNFDKFFAVIFSVVLVALLISNPLFAGMIVFGAVINGGILGDFSGKIGNAVGAKWRGIAYARKYAVPTYTNTTAQQTQRTKFSVAIDLARQVLGNLVALYWNPFAVKESGFNKIVREFIMSQDGSNKLTTSTKMAKGTLLGLGTLTCTYTANNGGLETSWSLTGAQGNGLATDEVKLVVYDKANQQLYFPGHMATREDGIGAASIASGLVATNLIAYIFAVQGSGSDLKISDSSADAVSAA